MQYKTDFGSQLSTCSNANNT